jgi:Cu(I)/Ag(I) efflux system membrane fusion protein
LKNYFKTEGDYIQKNQAVYQLYSEDLAIAKHDYFTAFKQLSMPGDFGKNAKYVECGCYRNYCFMGCQPNRKY